MRGVRGRGEPTGPDEEGPHKIGGGRLSDLPAAVAARFKAVNLSSVLHEESLQWMFLGSSEARHE